MRVSGSLVLSGGGGLKFKLKECRQSNYTGGRVGLLF